MAQSHTVFIAAQRLRSLKSISGQADDTLSATTRDRLRRAVAGDDHAAEAVIMALADALGFDAVDDGGLDDSWRQQPGSPVYGKDLDADGVREALREATLEKTAP